MLAEPVESARSIPLSECYFASVVIADSAPFGVLKRARQRARARADVSPAGSSNVSV